jgi:alanine racemase
MSYGPGSLSERSYTPKLAGLDDLGSSLITLTVNLSAYRSNLRAIVEHVAPAHVIAVVKANAYGFGVQGLVPILSEFESVSCGVATPDEALELRACGYHGRIILLGYTHPKCYYQIVHSGCQLAAYRPENIPLLVEAARDMRRGEVLPRPRAGQEPAPTQFELLFKVDTGITRLVVPVGSLAAFLHEIAAHPELKVVGLFSHLVSSGERDLEINALQAQRFADAVAIAERELGYRPECHLGNSGAVLNFPELHYDAVRIGILPFGILPPGQFDTPFPVEPVYRLTSEVIDVHRVAPGAGVSYGHSHVATDETTIATLPFGYADGLPRAAGNRIDLLMGGQRCLQVGTVTMDYIMADVGEMEVSIGDEVVLLGRQGDEEITIEELSAACGTIPYEVACAWGRRVRRVYVEG